jgi:hypothetical protein
MREPSKCLEEIGREGETLTVGKSPFLAHQLLVFATPANYGVVKIMHSSSVVVLRTMKHTMIYPSSGPSLEVIALCLVV